MKFIDEYVIKVFAGNGGDGFVDFLKRNRYISAGGSGGNGGSIYLVGSKIENTLLNISSKKEYHAKNGQKGGYQNSRGKDAQDLILKVPIGTEIFHEDKLVTKIQSETKFLLIKGAKGGRGNKLYEGPHESVRNHTFERGQKGKSIICQLKLEILADIGFVGKPSAGKSTILSVISNAKPKIAEYDFTTLKPQLGLVRVSKNKSLVAVDLPGIIASHSANNKIGESTLKTISKCRAIAHVIDFGTSEKDPIEDFKVIRNELKKYSSFLESLPTIIIANKMDKPCFYEKLKIFKKEYPDQEVIKISAIKQKNIKELKYCLFNIITN